MSLLISRSATSGGLHFEQRGRIVSIMGRVAGIGDIGGGTRTWFNIPSTIGAPLHTIGGTFLYDTTDSKGKALEKVYGIVWKCDGGTRTVTALSSSVGADQDINICITYITSQ